MTGKTELLDAAWESYILARRDWWDNPNDDTRKEYDDTWDVVLAAYDKTYPDNSYDFRKGVLDE